MSSSEAQRAQQGSRLKEGKPFARLMRHSVDRMMHGGDESGELDFGVGAVLALLPVPGAFATIAMLVVQPSMLMVQSLQGNTRLGPYAATLPDEYFFIVLAMVVAGAVAIWKWDALIPDRRDYVNLAPLPIPPKHMLYANLAALLLVAAALGFDVNLVSGILYPLGASGWHSPSGWYAVIFFATHFFSVFLASVFSFFIVMAILSLMMAVLPYRTFRRSSIYVRWGMVVLLMVVLSTTSEISTIALRPSSRLALLQWLPPAWFLGLCEHLRGVPAPAVGTLAKTAMLASVAVLPLAIAAYALSYRRCFTKSSESIANFAAAGGKIRHRRWHRVTNPFLRTPFERGCFSFTLKTLFRSENHMLVVGGFAGVGVVLASETLLQSASAGVANRWPSAALLSIPLIALYLLLIGLRFSFEIPAVQNANWIFRLKDPDVTECVGIARKIMLTFLIPLLLAIVLPVYGFLWGWRVGLIHTAVVAAASMLLIEILLVRYRKVPFTCSAPPFKSNFVLSLSGYFLGFVVFTWSVPTMERMASEDPLWYLGFILALAGIGVALTHFRHEMTRLDPRPVFEEHSDIGDVGVVVLNLSWVARDTERPVEGGQRNGD